MLKIAIGASSALQLEALKLLDSYDVVPNPYGRKLTEDEIIQHLRGAVGLLAGLEPLNEKVFAACPDLKAIARIGIGVENVDFDAAKRRGVKVSNTPDAPTYAVAEMTLAALLTIARRIPFANADIHGAAWKKRMGFSLRGSKILLIGYGRIAKEFERLLSPFNAEILKYDPFLPNCEPLDKLLPLADVASLHASGKDKIITALEIAKMKDRAVLLNTARGGLVDEDAVYDALSSGKLSYYYADTFSAEPYSGRLTELDSAVLTPHISTYTDLCRREMEVQAVKNLLRDLG
jgi:D-3-phosphoglycerate dehydrogenase